MAQDSCPIEPVSVQELRSVARRLGIRMIPVATGCLLADATEELDAIKELTVTLPENALSRTVSVEGLVILNGKNKFIVHKWLQFRGELISHSSSYYRAWCKVSMLDDAVYEDSATTTRNATLNESMATILTSSMQVASRQNCKVWLFRNQKSSRAKLSRVTAIAQHGSQYLTYDRLPEFVPDACRPKASLYLCYYCTSASIFCYQIYPRLCWSCSKQYVHVCASCFQKPEHKKLLFPRHCSQCIRRDPSLIKSFQQFPHVKASRDSVFMLTN